MHFVPQCTEIALLITINNGLSYYRDLTVSGESKYDVFNRGQIDEIPK